jgi:hypothetical protein
MTSPAALDDDGPMSQRRHKGPNLKEPTAPPRRSSVRLETLEMQDVKSTATDDPASSSKRRKSFRWNEEDHLATYDVTEYRDGFFDAMFFHPIDVGEGDPKSTAAELPAYIATRTSSATQGVIAQHWQGFKQATIRVAKTRDGVRLAKASLAYFIAYVLCLVPTTRQWLGGSASHLLVVSVLINHPSRHVGAQVDGTINILLGAAFGLGWGSFGLWLSTSTETAQVGYGAILASYLLIYMATLATLRSHFIRLYQGVLSAGVAVAYCCLTDINRDGVFWLKIQSFGIPWVLGQGLALVVCILVIPEGGARPWAQCVHDAFEVAVVSSIFGAESA